jgi:hypothetical protein
MVSGTIVPQRTTRRTRGGAGRPDAVDFRRGCRQEDGGPTRIIANYVQKELNMPIKTIAAGLLACLILFPVSTPAVWINEIHYDNAGADVGEFVEIAGASGTDLGGWSLVFYNGGNGASYKTESLSGVLPDADGLGSGFLAFAITGIQNGSPDGIALVDAADVLQQFLSYEGEFTATDGPAEGLLSTGLGVAEDTSTAVGLSLQLAGSGNTYADFAWVGPATATPGGANTGQQLFTLRESAVEAVVAVPPALPLLAAGLGLIGWVRHGRRQAAVC